MEWMLLPYKRYFDFEGRSQRKEYWMFALLGLLAGIVIDVLLFGIGGFGRRANILGFLLIIPVLIYWLGSIIPSLAVSVRRLHDQNRSGLLLLIIFIPLVGPIAIIVLMCLAGTPGPNRFGPDPKQDAIAEVF